MKAFRALWPFFKKNGTRYFFGVLALVVVDTVTLFFPQVLRTFIDAAQQGRLDSAIIARSVLAVAGISLTIGAGRFLYRQYLFGTARKLEFWLRDRLFQQYLRLDDAYFKQQRIGDLMAHATNDVRMVRNAVGGGVMMIVDAFFMGLLSVVLMVWTVGWQTTGVALLALPLMVVCLSGLSAPIQKRSLAVQNAFSEMTTEVQENFDGIRSIKAFGIESGRLNAFAEVNQRYVDKNLRLARLDGLFDPLITLFFGAGMVVFLCYGMKQIAQGSLTIGAFLAIIDYLNLILWPMIALGMIFNAFQRGAAAMHRINAIFEAQPTVQEQVHESVLSAPKGEIRFENVRFRYDEESPWILDGVSFTLHPGERVALVGRTGSGKSTVIDLMLRRYDPVEGRILLDGMDLRDLPFSDIYHAVSVVPQETFLFSSTIAENIAFLPSPNLDMGRVQRAARFAHVEADILGMPNGYETLVGERGVTLSGGQKQRVAIARAYSRNTPLLILDDSLSAVDTETENEILEELQVLDRGLLLISQRVSAVQKMNHILVLEQGRLEQQGTHAELVQQDGFYREMYEQQLLEHRLSSFQGGEE